jgi:hypothetical protein
MSMSVAAVAVLSMAILPAGGVARMEGTWPASIDLNPLLASPGDTVNFQGIVTAGIGEGNCVVEFAEAPLADATCTFDLAGAIGGSFVVPQATTPGPTVVSVCWEACWDGRTDPDGTPRYWQATKDFTVDEAAQEAVDVPDVGCQSLGDATTTLRNSRLNAKVGSGEGAVRDQTPAPGDSAFVGDTVYLDLQPVVVPNLSTRSYSDADADLRASCLQIRVTGTQEGTVLTQDPAAGTSAEAGDLVTVTFTGPATTGTPTGTTTDGTTTDGTTTDGQGTVVESTGHHGEGEQPSPTTFNFKWLMVILVAGTLAAGGWTTWYRATRPRRDLAWVTQHVIVLSQPGPGADYASHHLDPHDRDQIINVLSREEGGSTTVEEDPT